MTQIQRIMFPPDSNWQLPNLSELPSWSGAKRIGLDVETKDSDIKKLGPGIRFSGNRIAGISFAIEDGPAYYLPVGHALGQNLPLDKVLAYLKDQLKDYSETIVGANISYDLDWLMEYGITFPKVKWFRDVQIADPLIYELHLKYSLDAIAGRWEVPTKDEELLRSAASSFRLDAKREMWKLDARYVGAYAEYDARLPLIISRRQERVIDKDDLWQVYDLESRVLPVLVKMRRRGVRIDLNHLDHVENWAAKQEATYRDEIREKTGVRLDSDDLQSSAALLPVIKAIGGNPRRNKNGTPNIDKFYLDSLKHPVADLITSAKKVLKLRRDFVGSVRRHLVGDRIHCTFNQLKRAKEGDSDSEETGGAAYGRLSSEHPNLQQQPSRDEFAKMWRAIYMPDEGKLWACNDYSQQEPRVLTHFAVKAGCKGAREAAEVFRTNPKADVYNPMAEQTGLPRKDVKTIYLGLGYGMGGAKLCDSLGYPTEMKEIRPGKWIRVAGPEGQAVIDRFDQGVPFVRKLARMAEDRARERGYIITLCGRRCRFPMKDDGSGYDWTNKALNRLVQGSSADQTKTAMVKADEAGFELQLQVHDELDQSVSSVSEADGLAEIMRNAVKLEVPMRVDVETGPNWGDIQ